MQDLTTFLNDWTTAERDGDATALSTLLTEDFVGVGPLGFMLPKSAWLARHATGDLRYDAFGLDEVQPRIHGDAAVITVRHTAVGAFQGHPIPEAARATLVTVKDAGTWRIAGIHLSFIAGTPGAPPLPAQAGAPANRRGADQ